MTREEMIKELSVEYLGDSERMIKAKKMAVKALEQEPQSFKWCTDCKEYDQEKHCCHRYSKVIRDTIEEMKQEQEPFINKPCVSSGVCEHDKNKALDKIRAEIEEIEKNYGFDKATKYGNKDAEQQSLSYSTMMMYEVADIIDEIKEIIDKYKTEIEPQESKEQTDEP